ncbi:MAG: hypothetical protein AB1512_03440 [Thermodesulfobacteriota bacterium]
MGEIKSTLDIIMEKTRGLTLTEEEKRSFKEQELAAKVKGLFQRYLGADLTRERLAEELAALSTRGMDREKVKRVLIGEAVQAIQLGEDNNSVLKLLEIMPGIDLAALRTILADYEKKLLIRREAQEKKLMLRLGENGISGSAVVPNLSADREWEGLLAEMKEELRAALRSAMR